MQVSHTLKLRPLASWPDQKRYKPPTVTPRNGFLSNILAVEEQQEGLS